MRSEVSLYSSEADCRQPGGGQGLELVAQAGEGRREEAPCLLASSEKCLCFLSLFSICRAPAAFQASPDCVQGDKRADEPEISGGSRVTSQRHGGGGWLAQGGSGRVIGLTTSCTKHFSEGRFAYGSQTPSSNPGKKARQSFFMEEETPESAARTGILAWDFQQAMRILVLISLATQMNLA